MADYITYKPGYKVDSRKNPIEYSKKDMKHSSKWKKYMKKIHDVVMTELPDMCLIQKTNNSYCYHSNDSKYTLSFECRTEGIPTEQRCTAVIYNCGYNVFFKTKRTPKRLYNSILKFIDYKPNMKYYRHNLSEPPFVLTNKYIDMLKMDKVKSFVSRSAFEFTSFNIKPIYNNIYKNTTNSYYGWKVDTSDIEIYYDSEW